MLPWTRVIFFGTSASGQRAATSIGPGGVCSRAASGCSGRDVRKRAIAPKCVGAPANAGGVGGRARSTVRAPTASSNGGNNHGGIGNGCASDAERQLRRRRRARASAQRQRAEIFRRGRALGLAAMSFSRFPMNIRASVFAAWRAVWLYVGCWIAKRVTGRDAGGNVVSG
jgi:hypothetical protein